MTSNPNTEGGRGGRGRMEAMAKLDQIMATKKSQSPVKQKSPATGVATGHLPVVQNLHGVVKVGMTEEELAGLINKSQGDKAVCDALTDRYGRQASMVAKKVLTKVRRETETREQESNARRSCLEEEMEARSSAYATFYATAADVRCDEGTACTRKEMHLAMAEIENLRKNLRDVISNVEVLPHTAVPSSPQSLMDALSRSEEREAALAAELKVAQQVLNTRMKHHETPFNDELQLKREGSLASELQQLSMRSSSSTVPTPSRAAPVKPTTLTSSTTGVLPIVSEIWMPAAQPITNETGSFVPASAIGVVWED
eukprot:TRINITY_DN22846_c0_g1_i1.p1 TRINITY_DN22846_c0_g1~~TRINITY_DN22846_c0_g1_i1.p1  ORF type:complete len:313 (+),score=67.28 TRINITY_DN22846_c0_g1_i1:30-968(+)